MNNQTTIDNSYPSDNYKTLIFKVLNNIPEISLRKLIWNQIINYEEEKIEREIRMSWYDDISTTLKELAKDNIIDWLEIYYSD